MAGRVPFLSPLRVFLPTRQAVGYCTYRAGIHPTIAGVALLLRQPVPAEDETVSMGETAAV